MSKPLFETTPATASGYLFKLARNKRLFSTWHRRYYVLYSDGTLNSYKHLRSTSINRTIPIGRKGIKILFGEEVGDDDCDSWPRNIPKSLCFSVTNSDRSYHFVCESRREFERWEASLREVMHKVQISEKTEHEGDTRVIPVTSEEGRGGANAMVATTNAEGATELDADMEAYDKAGTAHPYLESPTTELRSVRKTGKIITVNAQDSTGEKEISTRFSIKSDISEETRKPLESVVLSDASGYDQVGPASPALQDSDGDDEDDKKDQYISAEGGNAKDKDADEEDVTIYTSAMHEVISPALLHHVDEIVHVAFGEMVAEETTSLTIVNDNQNSALTALPLESPEPPTAVPLESPEPPTAVPLESPEPPTAVPLESPEPPTAVPLESPEPPTAVPLASPEPPIAVPLESPEPPIAVPLESPEPPTAVPFESPEPPTAIQLRIRQFSKPQLNDKSSAPSHYVLTNTRQHKGTTKANPIGPSSSEDSSSVLSQQMKEVPKTAATNTRKVSSPSSLQPVQAHTLTSPQPQTLSSPPLSNVSQTEGLTNGTETPSMSLSEELKEVCMCAYLRMYLYMYMCAIVSVQVCTCAMCMIACYLYVKVGEHLTTPPAGE